MSSMNDLRRVETGLPGTDWPLTICPSSAPETSPMRQPHSVRALEDFGRIRLSENFFMRDFLYSEIAAINGFPNLPEDPDLAIAAVFAAQPARHQIAVRGFSSQHHMDSSSPSPGS